MQDNPLGMTNIEIAKKLPDNIAKFFTDSHNIQLDWEKIILMIKFQIGF